MNRIDEILIKLDKQEKNINAIEKRIYLIEESKGVSVPKYKDNSNAWREWTLALICVFVFVVIFVLIGYLLF